MVEIEIRGDGEVRIADQAVGHVTWTMPFANTDMVGIYEQETARSRDIIEGLHERIEALETEAHSAEQLAIKISKIQKEAGRDKGETYALCCQIVSILERMDFETWA